MPKKYLMWDFDNTLAYRNGMWTQTIYDLFQKYGCHDYALEDIRPYMTKGFPWHNPDISHKDFFKGVEWWDFMEAYFNEILSGMGVEHTLAQKVAHSVRDEYLDLTKWRLFDDTKMSLEKALNLGYTNIIVSNHVPELCDLVDGLKINAYFEHVYISTEVGYEKPNPRIFESVLADLSDMQSAVMIGDSYKADVQGARSVGIDAILVHRDNVNHYPKYSKDLVGVFKFL